jgi:hypothetical protein
VGQPRQDELGEQVFLIGGGCGWVGQRARRSQVAQDPEPHLAPPQVQQSQRGCTLPDNDPGITTRSQESRKARPAWSTRRLSCNSTRRSCRHTPTNSQQLQHFTADLPRRWAEHQAGHGSRLLAAALAAGCQVELVRVWYGAQARALEQRLKQRRKPASTRCGAARSLRPLCPVCNPAGWWRRYPDLADAPPPRRRRFVHDPTVWDAAREWDLAFPELAYGAGAAR